MANIAKAGATFTKQHREVAKTARLTGKGVYSKKEGKGCKMCDPNKSISFF
jgi:hypothetical protein